MFLKASFLFVLILAQAPVDEALEAHAKALENELIAPCCWRQPLSDHNSGAAVEMKSEIRRLLSEGKTSDEILSHFTDQHGVRILSTPPASGFGLLSYLAPWLALILGAAVIVLFLKKRGVAQVPAPEPSAPSTDDRYRELLRKELDQSL